MNTLKEGISDRGESLIGKTVLVTGASRGIGRAIALSLAARGARLAIGARHELPLYPVKKDIELYGNTCSVFACNLASQADIRRNFDKLLACAGNIDVLINNAGIIEAHATDQTPDQIWNDTLQINLGAAATLSELTLNHMIESRWGRIVNISSISGSLGEAYAIAYATSKAALNGMTASLARQTAKFGVTVNAVCPGWVDTDMTRQQLQDERWLKLSKLEATEALEITRLSSPQERLIQPEEIGEVVSFLCSDRAKAITGQLITVCGGLSLS